MEAFVPKGAKNFIQVIFDRERMDIVRYERELLGRAMRPSLMTEMMTACAVYQLSS
jgi:hypothetical protein